jgi:hypothetical protein
MCTCATLLAATLVTWPATQSASSYDKGVRGGGGGSGWTVLAPVSYKNLTLYPVRGRDLAGGGDYITLDEGIKNGTVIITEKGGEMARRRVMRRGSNRAIQQQVSMDSGGDASVNELALVNRSGKKLLLLAGEVIVGGKQDRIVEEDRIVPPVSVPISLSVFCVEHGRWSHRTTAASSGGSTGRSAGHPVAAPIRAENFSSLGAISHPKLRGAAQDKKEQGAVWEEVKSNNAKLGTDNNTDTYKEVYANKKVSTQVDDYLKALEKEVLQAGVVGVIVARGGELVWADCFASSTLFAKYWPKLLKSYVVDAMSEQASDKRPTVEQARGYLSNFPVVKTATVGQPGVFSLSKIADSQTAVFRLEDISLPTPLLVHFNKMQR